MGAHWDPWDPNGRPWGPNGRPWDPNGRPLDPNGRRWDPNGRRWDHNGRSSPLLVAAAGVTSAAHARPTLREVSDSSKLVSR